MPDPARDVGVDAPVMDPFDPSNRCGGQTVPTTKVPGHLLLVLDYSGSMGVELPDGRTRWAAATEAATALLTSFPDDLNVGLLLFPSRGCELSAAPQVPVGPLSQTRGSIVTAMRTVPPAGNGTPLHEALQQGYGVMRQIAGPGNRAVLLITDGEASCAGNANDSLTNVAAARADGIRTFAVGLDLESNFLSRVAQAGGTAPSACTADCRQSQRRCTSDLNCHADSRCMPSGACSCMNNTQCLYDTICDRNLCVADPATRCCNYSVTAANFRSDLQRALTDIASGFRGDCIFAVPRDSATFDPSLVNVGVTFANETRTVLVRSPDPSRNGWDYVDAAQTTLEVFGPVCQRLRMSEAQVEISLGCPTILQ